MSRWKFATSSSPAFLILLAIAFALAFSGLLTASGFVDVALYPLTFVSVPIIEASFDTILIIIAAYYGGEIAHAGIEPYNFYIDRNSGDNVGSVTG